MAYVFDVFSFGTGPPFVFFEQKFQESGGAKNQNKLRNFREPRG
jgi:hypothetical protein